MQSQLRQPMFTKPLGVQRPSGTQPRRPSALMPKRKVSSAEGVAKEEPKSMSAKFSGKPAPAKVEMNPKKRASKDKSADKKIQTIGKRGAKGKQDKVADQEPKADLPAENGETKNEESPDEAGEKGASAS